MVSSKDQSTSPRACSLEGAIKVKREKEDASKTADSLTRHSFSVNGLNKKEKDHTSSAA